MGYQVGNQCFTDRQQAENHYYSLVAPVVTADGKIIQPEYTGQHWQLNGQVLQTKLPECDPAQNVRDGMELGWLFFGTMAAMYVFTIIRKQMR